MNFVSFKFWGFLFVLAGFYLLIRKASGWLKWSDENDRRFLLIGSLVLFGAEDLKSLVIFLGISLFVYLCISCRKIRETKSRIVLVSVIAITILPLLFFKYSAFLGFAERQESRFVELIIPIGLSFYTFQLLSLFLDARTASKSPGNSEENTFQPISFLNFLNFGSFFPQIVAGPIERRVSLLPQLENFRFKINFEALERGIKNIVLGLFYKLVVADGLASSGYWIHNDYDSPWIIHLANLCFGLRIYGDFAGYSFIAVGIAQIFGVTLTWNFLSPYTQTSIRKFWRCWHVSLTQWLRDYVYIPLGGKKVFWASAVTFLVSGIWHGAGWNFVIWGAVHGLAVSVSGSQKPCGVIASMFAWVITMMFVMLSWLPFYQWDETVLLGKIQALATFPAYCSNPLSELVDLCGGPGGLTYFGATLIVGIGIIFLEWISWLKLGDPYGFARSLPVQILMILLVIWFSPTEANQFIYFSF